MAPKIKKPKIETPAPDIWEFKEAQSKHYIEKFKKEIYTDIMFGNKYIGIAMIGDVHLGNKGTDYEQAREDALLIAKTPHMYALLGGDEVDNFINMKITSAVVNKNTAPTEEIELFNKYLKFFKSKVLLKISGNHDDWTKQLAGINIYQDICDYSGITSSMSEARVHIRVGKIDYKLGIRHKVRFNSVYNLTHAVKQWLRLGDYDFDVGVVFHNHQFAMESFMSKDRERFAIRTGSYKVADVYGRMCGFNDSRPIMPVIIFDPVEKKMIGMQYLDKAAEYLEFLNSPKSKGKKKTKK